MKSMGKGVKFFKQGMNDIEEEVNRPLEEQQLTENQSSEQQTKQDGK
jgi:Sec-independent protein translocase protein TatA